MGSAKRSSGTATLIAVVAASVILPFGESVIGVQLAGIGRDLSPGSTAAQWIVNAYLLSFATSILAAGTLADRFGRRRVFVAGLWLCAASNIASIFVPSAGLLIALRALSGVAAGTLLATGPAILSHAFAAPDKARGGAFAAFGAAAGSGIALGPPIGGAVVWLADWRWVFVLYLPFVALALWLAPRIAESSNPHARRMDIAGVTLFSAVLGCVMLAMISGAEHGWASGYVAVVVVTGLGLTGVFITVERYANLPAVDMSLFAHPVFAGMSALLICWQLAVATLMVYVPAVLVAGFNTSAVLAGAALLPLAVPLFAATPLGPILAPRIGIHRFVGLCAGLMAAGQLLLWAIVPLGGHLAAVGLAAGLLVIGMGGGIANGAIDNLAMSTVEVERAGMAAGVFQSVRIGSAAVSVTLAGGLLVLPDVHREVDAPMVLNAFYHLTGVLAACIAVIGTMAVGALARAPAMADRR